MDALRLRTLLEPVPVFFRIRRLTPLGAGVLALIGLYGTLQYFRVTGGQPLWPGFLILAIGDPVLAISVGASKNALQNFEEPKVRRFYHKSSWFMVVAVFFTGLNLVLEANNVWQGGPLEREFSVAQIVHSLLVPIYALHTVGVMPHVWKVKGRLPSKIIATAGLVVYGVCFFLDVWKGGLV